MVPVLSRSSVIPQTPKDTLRDTVSIKQTQVKPLENEPPVREEIVKKGNSASELPVGSYIIVGAYNYKENADKMTSMALNLGYPAAVGFVSEKGYWYVYVKKGDSPDEIRPILPQVRQSMKIKDAWILTVYDGNQMTAGATSNPAVSPDTIQTVNLDTTSQVGKEAGALAKEEGIKVEMVHKGDNMFELLTGNYIIVGVFSTFEAAERYSDQLHRIGQNVKWGFNTSKNLWYDYLFFSATMDGIRDQLDNARKVPQMKDSWLLIVQ